MAEIFKGYSNSYAVVLTNSNKKDIVAKHNYLFDFCLNTSLNHLKIKIYLSKHCYYRSKK